MTDLPPPGPHGAPAASGDTPPPPPPPPGGQPPPPPPPPAPGAAQPPAPEWQQPQPPAPGAGQPPAPGWPPPQAPAPGFAPQSPPTFGGTPTGPIGVMASPLGIAVLVTLAIAAICSFLPWVTVDALNFTKSGTEGDGTITVALALVAAGLFFGYDRTGNKGVAIGALVCAALCAIVYVIDYADVSSGVDGVASAFDVDVGIGLIGGTITSIVATVLLVVVLVKGPKAKA